MPQTLLLADDSATIQRVIELTFADEDITVVAVSDGDQAIAQLESAPPDIVLADVGMPGKNGYEVAAYVKSNPRLSHIPVVLLTGAFEPVDQAKATAAGCDGVLAKPFEPQIVIGRVRELLGRSASADGNQPASARQAPAQASPFDAFIPAPPSAGAAPAPSVFDAPAQAAPESRVEDYFDRLDAAFANRSTAPAAPAEPPPPAPPELDWLRPTVAAPPQDFSIADQLAAEPDPVFEVVPEPEPTPAPVFELVPEPEPEPEPEPVAAFEPREPEPRAPLEPVAPLEPPAPLEPRAPRGPRVLPSIADAFGAILAAEQNALGVRPEWPSPASQPAPAASAPAPPAEIVITDDLVDRVARRVLEQLSDRVVRETVTSLASETAERLVREEIERIKAAVK